MQTSAAIISRARVTTTCNAFSMSGAESTSRKTRASDFSFARSRSRVRSDCSRIPSLLAIVPTLNPKRAIESPVVPLVVAAVASSVYWRANSPSGPRERFNSFKMYLLYILYGAVKRFDKLGEWSISTTECEYPKMPPAWRNVYQKDRGILRVWSQNGPTREKRYHIAFKINRL